MKIILLTLIVLFSFPIFAMKTMCIVGCDKSIFLSQSIDDSVTAINSLTNIKTDEGDDQITVLPLVERNCPKEFLNSANIKLNLSQGKKIDAIDIRLNNPFSDSNTSRSYYTHLSVSVLFDDDTTVHHTCALDDESNLNNQKNLSKINLNQKLNLHRPEINPFYRNY